MVPALRIAVSGIPRGHQSPGADGNWLTPQQLRRIQAIDAAVELHEIPAREVHNPGDYEILLATDHPFWDLDNLLLIPHDTIPRPTSLIGWSVCAVTISGVT